MVLLYLWPANLLKRLHKHLHAIYLRCRLTIYSLAYNHFIDASYVSDVFLGPIFWFIEKFTKTIGSMLVLAVCSLTASVVLLAYWLGVPHWWNKSPIACVFLLILGHWILVNVVYNYYMACTVIPGYPPEGELICEAVSICKKCIAPKPPRAHHCSVCNRCILKMDHHCPWLNNCVGYKNHRFFYLYMVYMVIGVFYLIFCGWEIAYDVLYLGKDSASDDTDLEGHSVKINKSGVLIPVANTVMLDPSILEEHELNSPNPLRRKCVIYMTLLNMGVFIALGCLSLWHGKMISRNETSIEVEINKAESLRLRGLGRDFINPYDLGRKQNWKQFLSLDERKNKWGQVLWPSKYCPAGDGLMWPTVHSNTHSTQNCKEMSFT